MNDGVAGGPLRGAARTRVPLQTVEAEAQQGRAAADNTDVTRGGGSDAVRAGAAGSGLARSPAAVVGLVCAGLVAVAVVAYTVALGQLPAPPVPKPHPPLALLTAAFVAAQLAVLNVQIGREARSVFLSEVPLAMGLVFVHPATMVAARMLAALAYVTQRRQHRQPHKLVFNLVAAATEAGVALLVYRAVVMGSRPVGPRGWVGVTAANVAASCVAAIAIHLVISLIEDELRLGAVTDVLGSAAAQAAAVSGIGCVCVVALAAEPWSAVLLVGALSALFLAFRAYASLNERHLDLERIYRFTQVVASTPEMSEVLVGVLAQARELLHAERALLSFVGERGQEPIEAALGRPGVLERGPATVLDDPGDAVLAPVFGGDGAVLVGRGSRDPELRAWLARRGLRELLAVPLRGDAGVVAVLAVVDRLGEARGFQRDDAQLLETVANHAAIALRNGRLVDQLRHDSSHDALTQLPNRAYFNRALDERLARPAPGQVLAVGVLDLDSFKDVNDTLGHARGDELLREVAARLTSAAAGRAVVARLGGDEFALLFPTTDEDAAVRFGRSLVASLHQPVLLGEVEVEIGGSLGLALTSSSGTDRVTLLKHADMAMYAAKQNGYDVTSYDVSLDRAAPSRLALVGRLRAAIAAGALEVHGQPQASLLSGEVTGVEALVRWHDAERGWVNPDEFIPLAERSGLIRPLTDLVLRRSIEAAAGWQAALPGVGVAVNLSVRSLGDDAVVEQVDRLLTRYGLEPSLLTLEITESSIMTDPAKTLDVLHLLRDLGVRLSVDDFGTGYSSLSYLRRLPVSELKIDRSFVDGLTDDTDDAAVARSIVDLGAGLGLSIVAEGVASARAWEAVRELGCGTAQGYYVSEPIPLSELVARHATWNRPHVRLASA